MGVVSSSVIGDGELARGVLADFIDRDGLTEKECKKRGINGEASVVLQGSLGSGRNGIITPDEREFLAAHFSSEFIQELAGDDGKKALEARVRWLGEQSISLSEQRNSDECFGVIRELGKIGSDAEEAVPNFITLLRDKEVNTDNELLFRGVVLALGAIGPKASAAIPEIIRIVEETTSPVLRHYAITALGDIGIQDERVISFLLKVLVEGDWESHWMRLLLFLNKS